ncbi:MAG: helix-turn-helix transcriptional regulator [Aureispira sp.]|nr:helix-turn-helix transcriptional regulator [Aureispira sp.]
MYLKSFPDIHWLKQQIARNFDIQRGWNGMVLPSPGFPNVILNVSTTQAHRPSVKGPLSLFMNISGHSYCKVDQHQTKISAGQYFISNPDQHYDLTIDSPTATETFNIHFGKSFAEEVYAGLITEADQLLNGYFENSSSLNFYNKLSYNNPIIQQSIQNLYQEYQENKDYLYLEEQLYNILVALLDEHRQVLKKVEQLPASKKSTRTELYRRLAYALDYIYSHSHKNIDLAQLAQTANLSKYHFLRLFKISFGYSPYQYLQQIRLEKALSLLRMTTIPIKQLAFDLGFDNASSFSRFFFRRLKIYPQQYRDKI